ncbi:MAG: radical SAM protein [Planctomycetota bacterium]
MLRSLCELPGDFRIRLSSIETTEVTKDLISVMRDFPDRVVPHLHLCLQAGSDSVLRRMRRRWGTKRFLDRCRLLRESLRSPAFTTDIIAGFPGETDEEFEETLATCREAGFSKIHAFPFSARRGTPAAEMPNQIPGDVKSERVARLGKLEGELRHSYFKELIGQTVEVLVESSRTLVSGIGSTGKQPQLLRGTTCRYAPAEWMNDPGDNIKTGDLVRGQVVAADSTKVALEKL